MELYIQAVYKNNSEHKYTENTISIYISILLKSINYIKKSVYQKEVLRFLLRSQFNCIYVVENIFLIKFKGDFYLCKIYA